MLAVVIAVALAPRLGDAEDVPARARASAEADAPAPPPDHVTTDDEGFIVYPLRSGDDPAQVARLFGVSIDDLLAVNGIRDPRRLAVGAILRIPDPRAARLARLSAENEAMDRALAEARADVAALNQRLAALADDVASLQRDNAALQSRLTRYGVWRAGTIVAALAALVLAVALALARQRAQRATRKSDRALREGAALRAAVDKYRALGGQLELKYQRLFASRPSSEVEADVRGMRRAYEQDLAALDAAFEDQRQQRDTLDEDATRLRRGKAA
ncbi:MAG TPA: LysM peptidoglycan-binding domain-containing protein [Candidatus Binatia bacterium]|nr:LysM peptidoglycan-binding domain-containing protein [Candidatus Binatia bacterium]